MPILRSLRAKAAVAATALAMLAVATVPAASAGAAPQFAWTSADLPNISNPSGLALHPCVCAVAYVSTDANQVNTFGALNGVYAGTGTAGRPTPGPAASSKLDHPAAVTFDANGNMYIADTGNNMIEKIDTGGTLSVVAGNGSVGVPVTGYPATSQPLNAPQGVAVYAGIMFIADTGNNMIHAVNLTTGVIQTFIGDGTAGIPTDGASVIGARVSAPTGLTIISTPSAIKLIVADTGNNVVESIDIDFDVFAVHFLAGTGTAGAPTEGPASSSKLNAPRGITFDESGNMFIADTGNHLVEWVNTSGALTIIAGNGSAGAPVDGDPLQSPMRTPVGVVGFYGILIISDSASNVIMGIHAATAPDAPTSLAATAGSGSASISFTAGSDGGRAISKYQYTTDNGTNWNDATGTTSPVTITGLTPGTTYSIKLRAVNSIGNGTPSSAVSVTPKGTPAAPTGLAVTSVANGSATISFTPGASNGASITKYQVKVGIGSWTDAGSSSPVTVNGLGNYTAKPVQIRAVNSYGAGTASSPITVRSRPSGPTITSATAAGRRSIHVEYSGVTILGATISGYTATAYVKGTNTEVSTCHAARSGRACTIPGLSAGTQYDVRMVAYLTLPGDPTIRHTNDSATSTVTTNS